MINLKFALDFAAEKHRGQKRKDGKEYITHSIAVAEIAVKMARNENIFTEKEIEMIYIISLFHDLIEDTGTGNYEIEIVLGNSEKFTGYEISKISKAVFDLTRISKKSSVINYLEGIKNNKFAKIVKLADLEHNLSDLVAGNLRDKYHLCRFYLNYEKY